MHAVLVVAVTLAVAVVMLAVVYATFVAFLFMWRDCVVAVTSEANNRKCRYRFDDRDSSTCAMSNATAIDASFGGEEWLCLDLSPVPVIKV